MPLVNLLLVTQTLCAGLGAVTVISSCANRRQNVIAVGVLRAALAMLIAVYTLGSVPIGQTPFEASFVGVAALILR
jgi:1,4-dihydroxy-2-naphthoate octaprenyltransferase